MNYAASCDDMKNAIRFIIATAYSDAVADAVMRTASLPELIKKAAVILLTEGMNQVGGDTEKHVEAIRAGLVYLREHGTVGE